MEAAGMEGDLSVSSDSHLQHLTAAAASRPDHDPGQSQAQCGVTRCRTDVRGSVPPPDDTRAEGPGVQTAARTDDMHAARFI